jgi:hypothetical protein
MTGIGLAVRGILSSTNAKWNMKHPVSCTEHHIDCNSKSKFQRESFQQTEECPVREDLYH